MKQKLLDFSKAVGNHRNDSKTGQGDVRKDFWVFKLKSSEPQSFLSFLVFFSSFCELCGQVLNHMQELIHQPYTNKVQIAQAESMKNHWKGLTHFMDDPGIPLDNNLAERGLRKPVVGRKNFYGNHSDRAKEATAIFYSITST